MSLKYLSIHIVLPRSESFDFCRTVGMIVQYLSINVLFENCILGLMKTIQKDDKRKMKMFS